jgi:hypothetical protein
VGSSSSSSSSTETVKQHSLDQQAIVAATCHTWMHPLTMTAALSAMIPSTCLVRQIVHIGSVVYCLFHATGHYQFDGEE